MVGSPNGALAWSGYIDDTGEVCCRLWSSRLRPYVEDVFTTRRASIRPARYFGGNTCCSRPGSCAHTHLTILKGYLSGGHRLDDERLKNPDGRIISHPKMTRRDGRVTWTATNVKGRRGSSENIYSIATTEHFW